MAPLPRPISSSAGGLYSRVRNSARVEAPIHTGVSGHRTAVPIERFKGIEIADLTKWFGSDRYTLVYFLTGTRRALYVIAGVPEPAWESETSWVESSPTEMREALRPACAELQRIIAEIEGPVTKWGFCTPQAAAVLEPRARGFDRRRMSPDETDNGSRRLSMG